MTARRLACLLALPAVALAACRGSRLPLPYAPGNAPPVASTPVAATPAPSRTPAARPAGRLPPPPSNLPTRFDVVRGRDVRLSAQDLAPVDAWLGERNTQWILGDDVDVYASKEYFSSMLTLNGRVGLVHRTDAQVGDDEICTLVYTGPAHAASAMTTPRAQIGAPHGLAISARRRLRVRMARTTDPSRPVQLRIVAHGNAAQGRHETVEYRADQIELGGVLRRSDGRWYWIPVNR